MLLLFFSSIFHLPLQLGDHGPNVLTFAILERNIGPDVKLQMKPMVAVVHMTSKKQDPVAPTRMAAMDLEVIVIHLVEAVIVLQDII